jgi:hypothetical protein
MAILQSTVIPILPSGGSGGCDPVTRDEVSVTNNTSTRIDSTYSVEGSTSLELFNNTNNYINTDLNYGNTDTARYTTIECWARLTAQQDKNRAFFEYGGNGIGSGRFFAHFHKDNGLRIYYGGATVGWVTWNNLGNLTNTWHHFAFVKNNAAGSIYLDGVEIASGTLPTTLTYYSQNYLRIGSLIAATQPLNGNMDLFRVSSIARYTEDFTPPTDFCNDDDTLLLLRFEGNDGDTSITSDGYLDDYT